MRNTFINTVIDCARKDSNVALLMAEVGFSVVEPFENEFPNRFFDTGIAEQDLVSLAAGMALAGMRPIAYSMSAFLSSRAFEQIKVDVCYQDLPVLLISTGSGLSYGQQGATHHATEESALMRCLPNLTVIFPSCACELENAIRYGLSSNHPTHISFPKASSPNLPNHNIKIGEPVCYREGSDGTLFAVGYNVKDAIKAAELLSGKGINLSIYGIHTLKPIDKNCICKAVKNETVFVLEEQLSDAGVSSDLAKILLEGNVPIRKFKSYSVPNCFANQVFSYYEQLDYYGLTPDKLSEDIIRNISDRL